MRPINVEITMGHNIGISASYYKPTENHVLEDYLKATDLLTISNDNVILQKEVAELQQKSKDNEYIIRGKLQEKDEEMKTIKQQFNSMQSQMQTLLAALVNMNDRDKFHDFSKTLFDSGIIKKA
jgi:seryl-tRNA synthetase